MCVTPTPLKPGALAEPELMGCGEERGPALRREPAQKRSCKTSYCSGSQKYRPVKLQSSFKRKINHTADVAFTGKKHFF